MQCLCSVYAPVETANLPSMNGLNLTLYALKVVLHLIFSLAVPGSA